MSIIRLTFELFEILLKPLSLYKSLFCLVIPHQITSKTTSSSCVCYVVTYVIIVRLSSCSYAVNIESDHKFNHIGAWDEVSKRRDLFCSYMYVLCVVVLCSCGTVFWRCVVFEVI
jgi:hypothetical protein